MFEWYIEKLGVKNGHQKDLCYDGMIRTMCHVYIYRSTILRSISSGIGRTHMIILRIHEYTFWTLIAFGSSLLQFRDLE